MIVSYGQGKRDFRRSPVAVGTRKHWEIYGVHHGRFGLVVGEHPPVWNEQPTVWILPPTLEHGKVGDGSICNVALLFLDNVPLVLEQICERQGHLMVPLGPPQMMRFLDLHRQISEIDHDHDPLALLREESLFQQVCLLLLEQLPRRQLPSALSDVKRRLNSALQWYWENMGQGPSLEQVARSIHCSESHFRRLCRTHLNQSAGGLLGEIQIDQARALLRSRSLSVEEVALACGYGSSAAFSRAFKSRVGQTPRDWRTSHDGRPRINRGPPLREDG